MLRLSSDWDWDWGLGLGTGIGNWDWGLGNAEWENGKWEIESTPSPRRCQKCFEFIHSHSSVMTQGSLVLPRPILLPVCPSP